MIDKEFIPYEQALELKELGFDEPCFGYYDEDIYLFTVREQDDVYDYWTPAPTYSQAFRFFREKYNLPVPYIQKLTKMGEVFYVAQIIHLMSPINTVTYEEAELACLNKLIEIVKSKQNG